VRTAGAAYWVREWNNAEPNGPMKIPESPNGTAVASSDGGDGCGGDRYADADHRDRGARSTAIGRHVHSKAPMNAPAATAVSNSPPPAGLCCDVARMTATTARPPGPIWPRLLVRVSGQVLEPWHTRFRTEVHEAMIFLLENLPVRLH
jgi:hypothetical protein